MLPDVNHPVWKQIVTGEKKLQAGQAAISLFIQSSKMSYGRDPSSENLNHLITRMHSFFSRYENAFSREIAQISL
jgi:hypothetical protein